MDIESTVQINDLFYGITGHLLSLLISMCVGGGLTAHKGIRSRACAEWLCVMSVASRLNNIQWNLQFL